MVRDRSVPGELRVDQKFDAVPDSVPDRVADVLTGGTRAAQLR
jgi:hypothetical protein